MKDQTTADVHGPREELPCDWRQTFLSSFRAAFVYLLAFCCTGDLLALSLPPTNSLPDPIQEWTFQDTNRWLTAFSNAPISFTNVSASMIGDGTCLVVDSPNSAWMNYRVFETNRTNLIIGGKGSVALWFAPRWASTSKGGSGPGAYGRLLEVGQWTAGATVGWWGLYFDPAGNNVYFAAQDNIGHLGNYVSAPIAWTTNYWHFIVLNYSSTNTALYIDKTNVANGSGVTYFPNTTVQSNGMFLGSDWYGAEQANGSLDDVTTYNVQLGTNSIENTYNILAISYYLNPANPANINPAPSQPEETPSFQAIYGPGYLTNIVSSNYGCGNFPTLWFANTSVAITNGTNYVTFTIAGGSNGVPYDLFATPELDDDRTNTPWAWLGRGYSCVTYTIVPGIPDPQAFFLLASTRDSYGNGVSDAYEWLVLHKNPAVPSGDGMLDGWKVLWGFDAAINNSAVPSLRNNYLYDGTGRLGTNSGIEAEIFSTDPEGNITQDTQ